jgi:hypothetical protein
MIQPSLRQIPLDQDGILGWQPHTPAFAPELSPDQGRGKSASHNSCLPWLKRT